jgi:hypothetical protein
LIYIAIYYAYLYPLHKLHELQTKEWMIEMTDHVILGVNDTRLLKWVSNTDIDNISFFYTYFYFHTKQYTTYILFNKPSKHTDQIVLNIYGYDFDKNRAFSDRIPLKMSDVKTYKTGDELHIVCGNSYVQKINMVENRMHIHAQCSGTACIDLELSMDDYNTNEPCFIPRYKTISPFVPVYKPITSTPGEWCSDNPMIGKIIRGTMNGVQIEPNGNYWFDNYVGVNDHFLGTYIWFVVQNDNWLVYLLSFNKYETRSTSPVFIMIKDRKNNKMLYCGMNQTPIPSAFHWIDNIIAPIEFDYSVGQKIGCEHFNEYSVDFSAPGFSYKLRSIPNKTTRVLLYDYYGTTPLNHNANIDTYTRVTQNYSYAEYVSRVNIEIEYQGTIERFKERCVIDTMFKKTEDIPDTF